MLSSKGDYATLYTAMTKANTQATRAASVKLDELLKSFSYGAADAWLRKVFGSYDTTMRRDLPTGGNKNERTYFLSAMLMGYVKELAEAPRSTMNCPLMVVAVHMREDLAARDSRVAQFSLAKRIIKDAVANQQAGVHGLPTQGLFFFHDDHGHFRLSLVTGRIVKRQFDFNSAKRQSFFVTSGADNPTIRRRFNTKISNFEDVRKVFSVEALTKDFYKSLFDWYIWATETDKTITFPNTLSTHADDRDSVAVAVIRLITRIMFIWFIKQKGLVPDELFMPDRVCTLLKEFDATSREQDNYYRVILQNLFFATLNCKVDKREFKGTSHCGKNHKYGITTCYRYCDEMCDKEAFMALMKKIPFLNCTLFDCLDKKERDQDGGREIYLDGFSDRKSHRAHIHNAFFFDEAKGIIPLFRQYEFTVNENSATDTDVALDPELLGKVFENLLGSYNPETKQTARKATGAFYTPREIVNYMVCESLKSYLQRICPFADNERLAKLFDDSATEEIKDFSNGERRELLDAIYNCKILDPACGSGAFPMGALNIMVHVLSRLDPNNIVLRERLLARHKEDREILLPDASKAEQVEYIATLDKQLREGQHYPDYARKLYLIENCIYGIDIQPIATQISKLRFFISLLCDQLRTAWNPEAENHGLLSLPNLEAKFVCADSLCSLPRLAGDNLALGTANLKELKRKLENCRHLVFSARTYETKNKRKEQELEIRHQIRDSIKHAFSTPDTALIEQYQCTLADLERQLDAVKKPKLELRTIKEQQNLFSAPQQVIREIDVNESRRRELIAQIKAAENAIKKEQKKGERAGTTELDNLAMAVSGWNPYDQNACSDFFDAEWMFNLPKGFDIVIGNPPYFVIKKNNLKKEIYKANHPDVIHGRVNIYQYFFSQAAKVLNDFGIVCYIHPKTLLGDSYLSRTRSFLTQNFQKARIINISDRKNAFEAVLQSVVISHWQKQTETLYEVAEIATINELSNLAYLRLETRDFIRRDGTFVVSQNPGSYKILDKIEKHGISNLNFCTGSIEWNKYRTNLSEHCSANAARLIYGANIQRFYFQNSTNRDLIYLTDSSVPRLANPSIITQRTTAVEQPNRIIATLIDPSAFHEALVTENNTNVCTFDKIDDAYFALGILCSNLVEFYFRLHNSNTHVASTELNAVPMPDAGSVEAKRIRDLVQQIITLKSTNAQADISRQCNEINQCVYSIYGLNADEIGLVESTILHSNNRERNVISADASRRVQNSSSRVIHNENKDDFLE